MPVIKRQVFATPYGDLLLGDYEQQLCLCDWHYRRQRERIDRRLLQGLKADFVDEDSALLEAVREQLTDYFNQQRTGFDIPLLLVGTEFQKQVWRALQQIPYGETVSYWQLAEQLGDTKAIRAVANANGANALSLLVPCHRVIGSDGKLVGYAGGTDTKARLLHLESGVQGDLFR